MAAKSPETEHPQKAFGWAARDSSGNLSPFNFSRSEPIVSPKLSHGDPSALTIDDSIVTHPDIHLNSAMAVHGIGTILDYTVYGGDFFAPPVVLPFFPIGKIIGGRRSDAACLCTNFPMVFSIVCAVFAFKIHRNPLAR